MKHYVLLLAVLFTGIAIAQDDGMEEDAPVNLKIINNKKHEFRIDALEGLVVPALDISYEYVLSKYSGLGATISYVFDDDNVDFGQEFAFTPYYRQYFFNKKEYGARGFFAEGLLQYGTGSNETFFLTTDGDLSSVEDQNWSRFGIGFAIGQKWVSRNGFVLELTGGGGRYFGDDNEAPGGFFRGGVNVGYRF